MGLFKRRQQLKFEIRVLSVGDIVLINGAIYKVEPDKLQQLAVAPIGQGANAQNGSN